MLVRVGLVVVLTSALAMPLAGCKIVQISDQESAEPPGFDAAKYAVGIWADRALPHFSGSAHPVAEVLTSINTDFDKAGSDFGYRTGEGSPWSFIVSGTGEVLAKNTESRAGTLDVAVGGLADPVVLQIGPVIRGNAVRDALPFVSFQDFTNQLEYADAGKALTALALEGVASSLEAVAVGDKIHFTGALSLASASDRQQVTLVALDVERP